MFARHLLTARAATSGFTIPLSIYNEEFAGALSDVWHDLASSTGSYDVNTTVPGALHMVGGPGTGQMGIYRSCPPFPFTVTTYISGNTHPASSYGDVGLMLGEATPGKFIHGCWDVSHIGQFNILGSYWPNPTTWSNNFSDFGSVGSTPLAHYSRFTVHSTTNVDGYYSTDGSSWSQWLTAYNPGFTIGSVGVDLHTDAGNSATFDWIRFT